MTEDARHEELLAIDRLRRAILASARDPDWLVGLRALNAYRARLLADRDDRTPASADLRVCLVAERVAAIDAVVRWLEQLAVTFAVDDQVPELAAIRTDLTALAAAVCALLDGSTCVVSPTTVH